MPVFKLDNFMGYQISQCQMCEKKKTRVQKWDKLFNAWICINCWEKIIKECLSEKPYKIDKNGIEYVEIPHQMENEEVVKTNIAVIDLERKLHQVNSILEGNFKMAKSLCKEHCYSCHKDTWSNCECGYENSHGCKIHNIAIGRDEKGNLFMTDKCKLMNIYNEKKNIQLALF